MKTCRKCLETYEAKYCKPCHYKACRAWEERNLEKAAALRQKWRASNPERTKQIARDAASRRRLEKPEEVRASARAWYAANPEKTRAWKRRYYEANADKCRAYTREWLKANPEKAATAKHNRRERVLTAAGSHTVSEWNAILKKHGYCCAKCSSPKDLTRDHIVPISKGGTNFAFNIQPLCRSCNSSKREFWTPEAAPSLFDSR